MAFQRPRNLSAQRHSAWRFREIGGLGLHKGIGGTAVLFEFRPAGEATVFPFAFVGPGLGLGWQIGVGSVSFPRPEVFGWETGRMILAAFRETGRGLIGREMREIRPPSYAETFMDFVDISCDSPFSAIDLHRAFGNLVTAKAAGVLGYSAGLVTARKGGRRLFTGQSTTGTGNSPIGGGSGVALGASANPGWWISLASL